MAEVEFNFNMPSSRIFTFETLTFGLRAQEGSTSLLKPREEYKVQMLLALTVGLPPDKSLI